MNKSKLALGTALYIIGFMVYYGCLWYTTVLVVRVSGYYDAGRLSLAMSITAAPGILALFNMRNYQISDINHEFNNCVYILSRICTCVLALVICIVMVRIPGYSIDKQIIVLVYMLYKVVEALADVFYGIEQLQERLDYAGFSLMIRGIGAFLLFYIALRFRHSLILGLALMVIYSFCIVMIVDLKYAIKVDEKGLKENFVKSVWELLRKCFPLAGVAFLNNYSIILPRLFLERYHGAEIMGYFASVSAPTLVIQLAANTIFAPLIPTLSRSYENNDIYSYRKIMLLFGCVGVILSALCVFGANIFGQSMLQMFFGDSIKGYGYLLLPIIILSILMSINSVLFGVCTLLRIIRQQWIIGIAGILASGFLSVIFVKSKGVSGVLLATYGSIILQSAIQFIYIYTIMRRWIRLVAVESK